MLRVAICSIGNRALKRSLVLLLSLVASCGRESAPPLFQLLSPRATGITFANTITTNDSLNIQSHVYVYNGAGVAAGDIDNDGLPDLFFSGDMVSSRLYLNKGNMQFEDITERAGVKTDRWCTGATMVDINNDGYLDIYVSVSGTGADSKGVDRANLLFVNNGDGTFREAARQYGIADTGFTTHTVFLDYNGDGYLDLFLLNNSPKDFARGAADAHPLGVRSESPEGWNTLYRNNGNGTFTNVSAEAGILRQIGYGLGVVVADVNRDGRPDIYVSNDVSPNDALYINNGNGTFTDKAAVSLKHTSIAGMGVDIADFNNDGWPDIVQMDMLPAEPEERKRMSGYLTYARRNDQRRRGFRDDYDANALQLSNGVTPRGDVVFSEIANLAGTAATDWSWSALFADFDNDGRKDIFVTNGYPKAPNDLDYQAAVFAARRNNNEAAAREQLRELRSYRVPNYLFRNNGDLTFSDMSKPWGMTQPGYSYGAAYVDLNNDGKLDLVVNNTDAPASIYENVQPADSASHYLTVKLEGEAPNRRGIGATLMLTADGRRQYLYHSPYRGFMSTMDDREHFGLGRAMRVDSLVVNWPDGRMQLLTRLGVDQTITVRQREAGKRETRNGKREERGDASRVPFPVSRFFEAAPAPRYTQALPASPDYEVQPLLPYEPSRQGPPIAVADVNGDGLDDVFVGGTAGVPGKLFLQQKDGSFVESAVGQPWAADKAYEDWGAVFFDANGDGRPDLDVASCGYQHTPVSRLLQDRLYINQGGGRFARDSQALPAMLTCTASVAAGDFNSDGRLDLFVGGRLTPRSYPYPARSYLLRNDGGHFTDVTSELAPELAQPSGMVTAAVWVDYDGDGRLDLVTAGEWMPLQVFKNEGNRFRNVSASVGMGGTRGWWWSLAAADFNHDGRPDLVAGNVGLNFMYTTSPQSPFGVYAGDFTGEQGTDIVLTQQTAGKEYPFFGRARLGPPIYPIALRFPRYSTFAAATVDQLFGTARLQRALHYQTDTFASIYLQNNGDGTFTRTPLPNLAQISPIRGILAHDVDGDGNLDLIIAGNLFDTEPNTTPPDAGNGLWLRGDGHGHFTPVTPFASGFLATRDVSGLALMKTPAGSAVLVANTGDSLQAFTLPRLR
ncbi:MAG TPA: VCBS repeat-containing protein [Gemmatimonadales bacterium]|nr:VCBS repeat-containing protein [Gemmatimonadales bacterium]